MPIWQVNMKKKFPIPTSYSRYIKSLPKPAVQQVTTVSTTVRVTGTTRPVPSQVRQTPVFTAAPATTTSMTAANTAIKPSQPATAAIVSKPSLPEVTITTSVVQKAQPAPAENELNFKLGPKYKKRNLNTTAVTASSDNVSTVSQVPHAPVTTVSTTTMITHTIKPSSTETLLTNQQIDQQSQKFKREEEFELQFIKQTMESIFYAMEEAHNLLMDNFESKVIRAVDKLAMFEACKEFLVLHDPEDNFGLNKKLELLKETTHLPYQEKIDKISIFLSELEQFISNVGLRLKSENQESVLSSDIIELSSHITEAATIEPTTPPIQDNNEMGSLNQASAPSSDTIEPSSPVSVESIEGQTIKLNETNPFVDWEMMEDSSATTAKVLPPYGATNTNTMFGQSARSSSSARCHPMLYEGSREIAAEQQFIFDEAQKTNTQETTFGNN